MLVFPSLQFFWLVLCAFRLLHNVCGVSCGVCVLRCGFEGAGAAEALSKAASTASGAGGGADVAPARQPITLIVLDSITGNVSLQYRYVARTHCPEIVRAEGFSLQAPLLVSQGGGSPTPPHFFPPLPANLQEILLRHIEDEGEGGEGRGSGSNIRKKPRLLSAAGRGLAHT